MYICCTNSKYKKRLHINNSKIELEKIKYKDIYWYFIISITCLKQFLFGRMCTLAWKSIKINFGKPSSNCHSFQHKDTRLQSFQYKPLHRILHCNEWLKNIRIKSESTYSYCNEIDTIAHFLINCIRNKYFCKSWSRW